MKWKMGDCVSAALDMIDTNKSISFTIYVLRALAPCYPGQTSEIPVANFDEPMQNGTHTSTHVFLLTTADKAIIDPMFNFTCKTINEYTCFIAQKLHLSDGQRYIQIDFQEMSYEKLCEGFSRFEPQGECVAMLYDRDTKIACDYKDYITSTISISIIP